jgi:hypothetical protein
VVEVDGRENTGKGKTSIFCWVYYLAFILRTYIKYLDLEIICSSLTIYEINYNKC